MKKQFTLLLFVLFSVGIIAQSNPTRATQLANLPAECSEFFAISQSQTDFNIVRVVTSDFTKKDPITKKAPLNVITYRVDSVTKPSHLYILNRLDGFVNSYNYSYLGWAGNKFTLEQPQTTQTVTVGPFAGQTYIYPYARLDITKTGNNYVMVQCGDRFFNTIHTGDSIGYPEPTNGVNPYISFKTEYWYKTFTSTRLGAKGTSYVRKQELFSATGWSDEKIRMNMRQQWQWSTPVLDNRIISHACDIEVNGNNYAIKPYFNGIQAKLINYRQMLTGYDKLHPGYVFRWKLYNGGNYPLDYVYGCTFVREYRLANIDNIDTSINIVADTKYFYDATTNTLHYDSTTGTAMLIGEYEENPAQGKNDMDQCYINLLTGIKTTNALGNIAAK